MNQRGLNGLQYLKVTNCESRQHLKPLENLFNVFYQDSLLKLNYLIVVLCLDAQLLLFLIVNQVNRSMKFQKNGYCIFNKFILLECNCINAASPKMYFQTKGARIWNNRFSRVL